MGLEFAIVGGGLTATSLLYQLALRLRRGRSPVRGKVRVSVFERQGDFGPGMPHSVRYVMPFHITNMCAKDMSVHFGQPADFQSWVNQAQTALAGRLPGFEGGFPDTGGNANDCRHYPRAVMGEYLKARFREAVEMSRDAGLRVDLHPGTEVTELGEEVNAAWLRARTLGSGRCFRLRVDRLLLATGHWLKATEEAGLFPSPWPAETLLRCIPQSARVGVIGSSLSAIEAALTLSSDGQFLSGDHGFAYVPGADSRHITLYSRNGLLPRVRGRMGRYRNRFLTRHNIRRLCRQRRGNLGLADLFDLLEADLRAAYGRTIDWDQVIRPRSAPVEVLERDLELARHGDGPDGGVIWQTVLHQAFPLVRDIYLALTLEDRERFDRDYTTVFLMHAATQPAVNAQKLLALMHAECVAVVRLGQPYRFVRNRAGGGYEFQYQDFQGRPRRECYRFVVDARGQPRSLESDPSELSRNLIASGTVQLAETHIGAAPGDGESGTRSYRTGSVWVDPRSHRVMRFGADGAAFPSPCLYAVGAMARGQIIDISMAYGLARSAAQVARDWARQIGAGRVGGDV